MVESAHHAAGPAPDAAGALAGPAAGASVMATGIMSVAVHLAGAEAVSAALLALASVLWVLLASVFAARLLGDRRRWAGEAVTPAALTGVAATGVLGTRYALMGRDTVAVALLALAAVLWTVLLPRVVRRLRGRVPGAAYLVCVSTQALVVLGATLALRPGARWLLGPSACLFVLGLALYVLVLVHFDLRQLRTGAGDHWVAGGAVSISTLASAKLLAATDPAGPAHWATGAHGPLRGATLALLGIALAWYAVLACCEVRWPRRAHDVRRWSTVFPLGMTAAAALFCATALHEGWPETAGLVLLWPALIVWTVVAVGTVRHVRSLRLSDV